MKITEIYKEYFQKSMAFLYPMLDIRKGSSTVPIQNHIAWEDNYGIEDCKLLCLYQITDDEEFAVFEKHKLLGNPLFFKFEALGNNIGLYVFDFSKFGDSFKHFVNGDYHLLDEEIKIKAYSFHKENTLVREYLKSYLFPDKYYKVYAKILGVEESFLESVVRLCPSPDLEKETIKVTIKESNSI